MLDGLRVRLVTSSASRRARNNCRNDIKIFLHPQSPRATFVEEPPPRRRGVRVVCAFGAASGWCWCRCHGDRHFASPPALPLLSGP